MVRDEICLRFTSVGRFSLDNIFSVLRSTEIVNGVKSDIYLSYLILSYLIFSHIPLLKRSKNPCIFGLCANSIPHC